MPMRTHRAIWLGLGAVILDVLAYFLLGYDTTIRALQILVLGVAVAAMTAWTPAATNAIKRGATTAADKIVLSIWMAWTVLTLQRFYTFFVVLLDRPDWLVQSIFPSIITVNIIVAGIYATFATASESTIPKQDHAWTMISVGLGSFVAGSFATFVFVTGLGL